MTRLIRSMRSRARGMLFLEHRSDASREETGGETGLAQGPRTGGERGSLQRPRQGCPGARGAWHSQSPEPMRREISSRMRA